MKNVSYIALSHQIAHHRQLDAIANNLANMNTAAFKGERVLFEEHLMRAGARHSLSYVRDYATRRNLAEGELRTTGNSLDVAINGKGYFAVATDAGVRYTRNGHFRVDAEGRLVTAGGRPLLDEDGQPIRLDNPDDGAPSIGADGSVSPPGQGPIAKLNVVTFSDEQAMRHEAGGIYRSDQPAQPVADVRIQQGMIEDANIKPVVEITTMIELLRNYQAAQRVIEGDHDRLRKAIERLGRVA